MFFLAGADICNNDAFNPIWYVVGTIINIIMIGVPILLVVFGMVDLGKAVISSKEDEVKKATKALGRRFLYAVAVFLVVWAVTAILGLLSKMNSDDITYNESSWKACWQKIRS